MVDSSSGSNAFHRNNSDGGTNRQLSDLITTVICRNEMVEIQKRLLMENEELKRKLNAMEEDLDILRIEQEAEREKRQKDERQREAMEAECRYDLLLEEDRTFAMHLLTDIWRGTVYYGFLM